MSYARESLFRGEKIIYRTSLHWIIFIESFSILAIGLLVSFYSERYRSFLGGFKEIADYLSLIILIFGGVKFLLEFIRLRTSEFAVTTDRIMIKVGVLKRTSTSMPLSKIESIEIDQTILGRMMNFGSLHITGTGTAESKFDLIANPHKFRRKIQLATGESSDEDIADEISNRPVKRPARRRRRR